MFEDNERPLLVQIKKIIEMLTFLVTTSITTSFKGNKWFDITFLNLNWPPQKQKNLRKQGQH